jgi:hypothetical protein
MPLQNRVTPLGELVATPEPGLVYGNRGWHRAPLLAPGRFTELFFLDEATALAAGHRPCALCRHDDYEHLAALWVELHPGQRGADAIDAQLHAERVVPGTGERRHHESAFEDLPDGAFVLLENNPHLVLGAELMCWSPAGYLASGRRPPRGPATLLTPPSLVELLRTERTPLVPFLHESAGAIT